MFVGCQRRSPGAVRASSAPVPASRLPRRSHWFGVAFLGLAALSALIASRAPVHRRRRRPSSRSSSRRSRVLTSDFARDPERRAAIVLAVLIAALVTGAEVVIGLALFYAGTETSLVHGWLTERSDNYARMSAGFYSAPLMGSFCVVRLGRAGARRRRHPGVLAARRTGRLGALRPVLALARHHRVRARVRPA